MKCTVFILSFFLSAILANVQSLHRDNLLGIHPMEVKLNAGVTLDEFADFFNSDILPKYEKHWLGLKAYVVKSVRGEYPGKLAVIWVFATEPTRHHYFNADGTPNQLELDNFEKVKPIEEELKKRFGTYTISYKDDWVVE
jgi:hypothetical protein